MCLYKAPFKERTEHVVILPVVVVLLVMMMGTIPGSFEQGPKALDGVGVDRPVRVGYSVVDDGMGHEPSNDVVGLIFV